MGREIDDDDFSADEGRDAGFAGAVLEGSRGTMVDVRDRLETIVTNGEVTSCAGAVSYTHLTLPTKA